MINLVENMRDLIEIVNEFIFDPLVEMANLRKRDTGLDGIIFISTKRASHGPRIKYYPDIAPGGRYISLSIEREPKIKRIVGMQRREATQYAKKVSAWVIINQADLLNFWNNGTQLDAHEVSEFVDNLRKI